MNPRFPPRFAFGARLQFTMVFPRLNAAGIILSALL
jgi:hypothetical protein